MSECDSTQDDLSKVPTGPGDGSHRRYWSGHFVTAVTAGLHRDPRVQVQGEAHLPLLTDRGGGGQVPGDAVRPGQQGGHRQDGLQG